MAKYRNRAPDDTELRLLPQGRFTATALPLKQDVVSGGLFAFVRGTDPGVVRVLASEARGKNTATARWQFAATRMTQYGVGVTTAAPR